MAEPGLVMDGLAANSSTFARGTDAEGSDDPAQSRPLLWILTGSRVGDNNQMLALADALGLPFEAKTLKYNALARIAFFRGERLAYLTRDSRQILTPPWPDLIIGVGYASVPVSRSIRRRSGGRTRLVQIGNPRTAIDDFDLVIMTPQYSIGESPNVLTLPFPIGNPARAVAVSDEEETWLRAFPRPRRLVAVGGSTRQWKIDNSELDRTIRHLQALRDRNGGSVIAATSRRTTPATRHLLQTRLIGETDALVENFPRFGVLLARCDEFYVTADSVSMLSEAILTGKPVGMIPIARSLRGKIGHTLNRRGWNLPSYANLADFWRYLTMNDLVGSVEAPIASKIEDTVNIAAKAVRSVLGRPPVGPSRRVR
jgi:mitochondrial fission protein ELM1